MKMGEMMYDDVVIELYEWIDDVLMARYNDRKKE